MKNILLTAVGGTDPYTINEKMPVDSLDRYNDGSILSILRKLKRENETIDEVFMYLSLEMALPEVKNQIFSKSIKSLYENENDVKITFFPEGIIEEISAIVNEIEKIINQVNMMKIENLKEIFDKKVVNEIDLNYFNINTDNINILKEKNIKEVIFETVKFMKMNLDNINEIEPLDFNKINDIVFIILRNIKSKNEILLKGRIDVNEYGTFYADINQMLDKIKEENNEDYKVFLNITSGTPAMKSDINLLGITNPKINSQIIQVSTPERASNRYPGRVFATPEDLKSLNAIENSRREKEDFIDRTELREMKTTKKLILLKSLEDSFQKYDFAGVENAIKENASIISNKRIINYSTNLYNRYIGNRVKAIESYKNLNEHITPTDIDVYPMNSITGNKFKSDLENIIEKFNVMKIKEKRNEFNDWLLISTPVIESIAMMILECNGLKAKDFTFVRDGDEMIISIISFNKSRHSTNEALKTVINDNNKKFVSAYRLLEIMNAYLNSEEREELIKNTELVDTTRSYRIRAAHSPEFISKQEFENLSEFENSPVTVEDVHNSIKYLLKYLYLKLNQDIQKFEDACNIYELMQNKILDLLRKEINTYKEGGKVNKKN